VILETPRELVLGRDHDMIKLDLLLPGFVLAGRKSNGA